MLTWVREISPAGRQKLIEILQKSVAVEPEHVTAWLSLGDLLLKTGRFAEAAAVLSDAAERLPTESELRFLLADARRRLGDTDGAVAAMQTALALVPHDDEKTMLRRFDFYVNAHQWDRVAQDLHQAAAAAPTHAAVIFAYAHAARIGGDPAQLLTACEAALARKPSHTAALHYKAVALAMLGRNPEACSVIGLDDFVGLEELSVDHIGGATFLDDVAGEILHNPTLIPDPHQKATRDGFQTTALMQPGDKAMPIFLEQIRSAVERYIEALPNGPHAFSTARPPRVRLNPWAVVYPQEGRQASHFHARGWISGVAYIAAPRTDEQDKYRGPLVLGEVDNERLPDPPPWGTREVEPVPGRIALFPSFVPHATRPSGLAARRICVAFDVVPA
jgi:tetratricopeptide (TPR) repeat protein